MKPACLFLAALALSGAVFANKTTVRILDQNWSISFDAPPLEDPQGSDRGDGEFAYKAHNDRFNLSLFVENPSASGRTHKDCYQFYWPQARRNPMMDQRSVAVTETAKYVRVQYDLVTTFQGKPIRDTNVNYYFAYREKWMDVHISIIAPEPADAAVFAAFDRSLDYGPSAGAPTLLAAPAPKDPAAEAMEYLKAGSVAYIQHDYAKAIGPYRQALELEKKHPTLEKTLWRVLVDNLGMAYGLTGDLKSSKETFEYGITRDDRYPMFYYNLACTFAEMNDLDGAIANLKKAYEYKDNQIEGEHLPDPREDSSFQRFLKEERFLAALKEMEKVP